MVAVALVRQVIAVIGFSALLFGPWGEGFGLAQAHIPSPAHGNIHATHVMPHALLPVQAF
ncbi:MAG: hypothetical protein FD153_1508 [Rhodospirillaceae bacterium]|nr:MAG: hypothetical protein FD153_1508 [Rhodospirillaceae bacterium]